MNTRRETISPVPWAPLHRRSWRTLWRRCSCGLPEPCVDRALTAPTAAFEVITPGNAPAPIPHLPPQERPAAQPCPHPNLTRPLRPPAPDRTARPQADPRDRTARSRAEPPPGEPLARTRDCPTGHSPTGHSRPRPRDTRPDEYGHRAGRAGNLTPAQANRSHQTRQVRQAHHVHQARRAHPPASTW
jgi:hypothetical protein